MRTYRDYLIWKAALASKALIDAIQTATSMSPTPAGDYMAEQHLKSALENIPALVTGEPDWSYIAQPTTKPNDWDTA